MPHESSPEFTGVSVIVAAYQAASTIKRTLASIAAQTLKPREVVVVDDGSTDRTFEEAKALGHDMNGIRLQVIRSEENQGAGAARNRAIMESTESFLAFLDSDDEWLPEKLKGTMPHLESGDYSFVAHDYLTGDGVNTIYHDCAKRFREDGDAFVNLYRKGYIASSSVVAHRDVVFSAGGYDPSLPNAQDFDLWLAMTRSSDTRYLIFGEALLHYHPSPGGIMSHTERRLQCCLIIARRYIPDIKQRPGGGLSDLWFRVAALHLEAIRAYGKRRKIPRLLLTVVKLPLSLLTMTIFYFAGNPQPRGHFLATDKASQNG